MWSGWAPSRQAFAASKGNPAQCLMRFNRSSSSAAIRYPSRSNAADASPWNALSPRMFIPLQSSRAVLEYNQPHLMKKKDRRTHNSLAQVGAPYFGKQPCPAPQVAGSTAVQMDSCSLAFSGQEPL